MLPQTANTVITTPNDTEIVITRIFNAPRQLVFDAWTKPEHVTKWMLGPPGWTMPVCNIDLRVGGRWDFTYRRDDGTEISMGGVYREIEPPARLVSTESWGGDWADTQNTLLLTEEDGKTKLHSTMLYPNKEARDAALQTGMTDGMDISYDRLDTLLASLS